ncbi:MAG: DUF2007 domain-containing protein [Clostridiaceae bacterium]|nr:DUF2007 domain-containing protein [Clostridiaceae bacterium]
MAWCPKCRLEYRDGFEKCNDCDIDLVGELENSREEPIEFDSEVFLTSVSDNINSSIIEAKLNDNGIPVLKKYREAGGYLSVYMGVTSLGVDLYVPSKLLDEARRVIQLEVVEDEANELISKENSADDDTLTELNKRYQKKRQIRGWIILVFLIPGLIWVIYAFVMMLIKIIF